MWIGIFRRDRRASRIAGFVAVVMVPLLVGCGSLGIIDFSQSEEEERRALELESLLDRYTSHFTTTVEEVANVIIASSSDVETKLAAVRWKLRVIPRVKEFGHAGTSQGKRFLALWLFTEGLLVYIEDGEGGEELGAEQQIAALACRELAEMIEQIAKQVIETDEDFHAARDFIRSYARSHVPHRMASGTVDFGSVEIGILELAANPEVLGWLPSFSLKAFNPFSGLNESATAIRHFTEETNALIEEVYTTLPWRLELLLYDLEGRQTVLDTREDMRKVSESAASLAATAGRLPAEFKDVVVTTLDEIDAKQEGLRLTLQQAENTLLRAETLISDLRQTAAYLKDAGLAWDATFQTLGLGDDSDFVGSSEAQQDPLGDSASTDRPFDILDYRDTAREIRDVATELRRLIQDVHALTDTSGDNAPLNNIELAAQTAAAAAIGEGRDLVDHAALRLFQLLGAILVTALLYRLISSRLAHSPLHQSAEEENRHQDPE